MESFQTTVFTDHGRRNDLLNEWYSLSTRQNNVADFTQKIEDRQLLLSTSGELSPVSKKPRVNLEEDALPILSSSSSTQQPTNEPDDIERERIVSIEREIALYEGRIPQVNLSNEEKKFFQAFLPSPACELMRGLVVAGFSYSTSRKPFALPSHAPKTWDGEGSLLRSVSNVDYLYTLDKFENGIALFRLSFVRAGFDFSDDLPVFAMMQEEGLDDNLLLTTVGLSLFTIEDKLRSSQATDWGRLIVDNLKAASLKRDETPRPSSPLSTGDTRVQGLSTFNPFGGPEGRNPELKTFVNSSSSSVDPYLQSFLSMQTQAMKEIASSVIPFKTQAEAKSAEKTRVFLLKTTACRANILAVLGPLGDVNSKEKFFPRDLCDRFAYNAGVNSGSVLRDLPLFKDGIALQQFMQGRCPLNFNSIRWDPSKPYGTDAGICVSHFLPSRPQEDIKGFPFFPCTKPQLTSFFANISLAFKGLFDKDLLDKVDYNHPFSKMYSFWQSYWLNGLQVATNANDSTSLDKMDEFYLFQYLQAFLHQLFNKVLAQPDEEILKMIVGKMTDLNGCTDATVAEQSARELKAPDPNLIAVQNGAANLWYTYFCDEALEEHIGKHKKDHHWSPEMSKQSINKVYEAMLIETAWTAYDKKVKEKKSNTSSSSKGSGSSISNAGGRGGGSSVGGRSGSSGRGGGRGGGRGQFSMGPPTNFPNQFPVFTGTGGYGSGSSVSSALTGTIASAIQGAGSGIPKGPALDCINHLKNIFNPATTSPCRNLAQGRCRFGHPSLPPSLPDQLNLLQINHQAYQSLSDSDRTGAPNRVKAEAVAFLAETHQKLAHQGVPQTNPSGSSVSTHNKG